MTALLVGEKLHRDVHPADVLMGDGSLVRDVRVFVTDRRLLAYAIRDGHLVKALECELEQPCSVPANRGTLGQGRLEARLSDGSTAWVNAGRGCGCHSPLRMLAPPVTWTG